MNSTKVKSTSIAIAFALAVICTGLLFFQQTEKRELHEDFIELSRIKYGMFNVDQWRTIVADIISLKIGELNLEGANENVMREKISTLLYQVIQDFERSFMSTQGAIERGVANITGIFDQLNEDVPMFTETILDFLNDPENREGIRNFILLKLDEYADRTFQEVDYTQYNAIIAKYQVESGPEAIVAAQQLEQEITDRQRPFAYIVLILIAALCFFVGFTRSLRPTDYTLLTLLCYVLLGMGLLLPMIDIDARIAAMRLTLLGEPIEFTNQVLFFQSKSIIEVASLMLTRGKLDLFSVGVLVLAFSVIFPILKLASGLIYVHRPAIREHKFVNFLLFKSGKWSMADVMVVAIFMAYVGFSGIVTDQLRQLESIANNLEILTTNYSSLQIGFYVFTGFAILSLLVAHKMQHSLDSITKSSS